MSSNPTRTFALATALAALLAGCVTDPIDHQPAPQWTLAEPEQPSPLNHPSRSVLPETFIDHTTADRRYPGVGVPLSDCVDEQTQQPARATTIGMVYFTTQFSPPARPREGYENFRPDFDPWHYRLWVRFPNISADWHRFEMHWGADAPGDHWQDSFGVRQQVMPLGAIPHESYNIWIRDLAEHCGPLTEDDVMAFRERYLIAEVIYENPITGFVQYFPPAPPREIRHLRWPDGRLVRTMQSGSVQIAHEHLINGIERYAPIESFLSRLGGVVEGEEYYDEVDHSNFVVPGRSD